MANSSSAALNSLGVAMGCGGSVFINVGNNLQAMGHQEEGRQRLLPIGTAVFLCGSLCVFAAFTFAPASVVAPLESLQFVVNLAFQRVVNRVYITPHAAAGTLLILLGTVAAVVFGPIDASAPSSLRELEGYWESPGWLVYLGCILSIAALVELGRRRRLRGAGGSQRGSKDVEACEEQGPTAPSPISARTLESPRLPS